MSIRPLLLPILGLILGASIVTTPAHAQWVPNGVPVCRAINGQDVPQIAADGAGGAFVVWRDERDFDTNGSDIYAQRIAATGTIAPGWPEDGVRVGPTIGSPFPFDVLADDAGGAYILWGDGTDIYLQRITGEGQVAAGWPAEGFPACTSPGPQWLPSITSDGQGGVFVVWQDGSLSYGVDIFAQRISPHGTLAPGWPVNGLVVCDAPDDQITPSVAADGRGGVFVVWTDLRNFATTGHDLYGVRLTAEGTVAQGWQAGGSPISAAPGEQATQGRSPISDGEGGMIVAWVDGRNRAPFNEADIYAQRMTGDGQVAQGWPENGIPLCTSRELQWYVKVVSDGAAGAIVAWEDYRNYDESAADVYAQRVLGSGMIAPGWPVNGLPLVRQPLWDVYVDMVQDCAGGAYVVCTTTGGDDDLFIQRLTGAGTLANGWEPLGRPLCVLPRGQTYPTAVADGAGGLIVAWNDARDVLASGWDIYAQWVPGARPTPSTPQIAGSGLHRTLLWALSEPAPGTTWAVLRARNRNALEVMAQVTAGAGVEMSWEDTSPPGGVLRYRIRRESANPNYRTESDDATWPPQARALTLARPAGAGRAGDLELTGAAAGPIEVQVFDIQGRLVLQRRTTFGAAGEALRLDLADELRARGAGIYFARAQDSTGRPTEPLKLVLLK